MSRDDHGVSAAVRESPLASLLDAPPEPVVRHFAPGRSALALCGDATGIHTNDRYSTTCETCRAAHKDRMSLAETRRVLRKVGQRLRKGA